MFELLCIVIKIMLLHDGYKMADHVILNLILIWCPVMYYSDVCLHDFCSDVKTANMIFVMVTWFIA